MTTHNPTPQADHEKVLEKAREPAQLLLELQEYLSKDHPDKIFTVIPSLHAELERLNEENEKLRKGYTGMRDGIEQIEDYTRNEGGEAHTIAENLLTSYPKLQ